MAFDAAVHYPQCFAVSHSTAAKTVALGTGAPYVSLRGLEHRVLGTLRISPVISNYPPLTDCLVSLAVCRLNMMILRLQCKRIVAQISWHALCSLQLNWSGDPKPVQTSQLWISKALQVTCVKSVLYCVPPFELNTVLILVFPFLHFLMPAPNDVTGCAMMSWPKISQLDYHHFSSTLEK